MSVTVLVSEKGKGNVWQYGTRVSLWYGNYIMPIFRASKHSL